MSEQQNRLVNRELSWLEFNQRVLDEALDPDVPLLERLFFLTIVSSNLDEFFMVRVGGLKLLVEGGVSKRDPAGFTPKEQYRQVCERSQQLIEDQYRCYRDMIEPALATHGIARRTVQQLSPQQLLFLTNYFETELFPIITPMAVDPGSTFPLLGNLKLYIFVVLKPPAPKRKPVYAMIPVGPGLERVVQVPEDGDRYNYVLVEDVIGANLDRFFPGYEVMAQAPFRITRNADFSVEEEFAVDLVREMQKVLRHRKTAGCVRLEIAASASVDVRETLSNMLDLSNNDLVRIDGPLDLTGLRDLMDIEGFAPLRYETWPPQPCAELDPVRGMFDEISRRDILLSLPFEQFDPVVRLVSEASVDPDVLAIKQVLYRTSRNSPIIAALRRAVENGKNVTAVIELKARFDEANNIEWARELERAGIQVIYGIKGLKTHAKICVIVRRELEGIVRYVHFGTGNYNDKTAKLYTDVGLLTRNSDLGMDASAFFNAICGYSEPRQYLKLVQSPLGMREAFIELIDAEAERARHKQKARILAKMNSLVDPEVIEALYAASCAGVNIQLNVRGICCLRPGIKGLSENIRVISIVDRFLEHSRIFYFHHGGMKKVFIASADWMPRNLSRRIELMIPVEDADCKRKLMRILKTCLADTVKARTLTPDGTFVRMPDNKRRKTVRCQDVLYREACKAAAEIRQMRPTVFEPHRPPETEKGT
jgi:polyphosphate kinase